FLNDLPDSSFGGLHECLYVSCQLSVVSCRLSVDSLVPRVCVGTPVRRSASRSITRDASQSPLDPIVAIPSFRPVHKSGTERAGSSAKTRLPPDPRAVLP